MSWASLNDAELVEKLERLTGLERQTTAQIGAAIAEVDRRRLFLRFGFPSLYAFLTEKLGYSNGSACRRIEAARALASRPTLVAELRSGELNLMHTSRVAQAVREVQKQNPEIQISREQKSELLAEVRGLDAQQTDQKIAEKLGIAPVVSDRQKTQADGSVRVEITLAKEEYALLQKARELLSHTLPAADLGALIVRVAKDFVDRRSPETIRRGEAGTKLVKMDSTDRDRVSRLEVDSRLSRSGRKAASSGEVIQASPRVREITSTMEVKRPLSRAELYRQVHRRDQCCQWKDPRSGRLCGSRYLLQIDHIQPKWAGGLDSLENLQLLCGAHNRMKYQMESGVRVAPPVLGGI